MWMVYLQKTMKFLISPLNKPIMDVYPKSLFEWPSGSKLVIQEAMSKILACKRHLYVYLPPSYGSSLKTYPVIYFQDGQNLFQSPSSLAQNWGLNFALDRLADQGMEIIVVGVEHGHQNRCKEFNPFIDGYLETPERHVPYLEFLVKEVKPYVDRCFRSKPGRDDTGIIGASLGGLISLAGFFYYPVTFGLMASMSNWMWVGKEITPPLVYNLVQYAPFSPGRLIVDIGTSEYVDQSITGHEVDKSQLIDETRHLRDILIGKGYKANKDLFYFEVSGGEHSERDWGARIERYLFILLY